MVPCGRVGSQLHEQVGGGMMEHPRKTGGVYYGWFMVVLLLYTLIHTGGNGIYGFMVFVPRLKEDLNCSAAQVQYAVVVWAIFFGLSSPLVGGWIQKFGARKMLIAGTCCVGLASLAFSMITSVWQLYAVFVLMGITAAATIFVPAQTLITVWFDKYRGKAMALVLMGIGIGGFFVPWLITKFLVLFGEWNSSIGNGAEPPVILRLLSGWRGEIDPWRGAVRAGVILNYLIVVPPIVLWLKNRPADVGQFVDGVEPAADVVETAQPVLGISAGRAVRTGTFWLLLSVYLLQLVAMSGVQNNQQLFLEVEAGYPLQTAYRFYSWALLMTIPMRYVFGWLSDHFDPKYLMSAAGICLICGALTLWFPVLKLGWRGNTPALIFAFFQGIGVAGNTVALPILVGRCFGVRDFGRILGFVMMGFAVGVIFGSPVVGWIYDKQGSFELGFLYAAVLLAVSVVLVLLIRTNALHSEFTAGDEPEVAAVADV